MKNLIALTIAFLLVILGSCSSDPEITTYDAELYASYSNPVGGEPILTVDMDLSSIIINMETTPTVSDTNGRILFNYSAVTFKEDNKVYSIDEIVTQRKSSDKWLADDENTLTWSFSKSLDIVLVLDVSSSLGDNISTIKNNAQKMLEDVLQQNPDARISVVKFSRGNVTLDFTSEPTELSQFINRSSSYDSPDIGTYELEGRQETALYEAIDVAIDLLVDSEARGKGILSFTDGVSNFQFDTKFQTPGTIINKLIDSEISNYTIGYEGNQGSVDRSILEDLAVNGDFSFPANLTSLNEVFQRFSNTVAAVYDLVYNTNNAKFDGPLEYKFLFSTTVISK